MFTFLKRNIADLGLDAPIHSASPAIPLNSEDTLGVTGEHLPEDTALLLAPPSIDLGFGEEKTKRPGSGRMFRPETPCPLRSPRLQSNQINAIVPLAL